MSALVGAGKLLRLALRRDRIKLPVTVVSLGLMFFLVTAGAASVYQTEQERTAYAVTGATSGVALAFNGPVLGNSVGSITFTETFTFFALFIALTTTLLVVRHTRQNEETGMSELIGAGAVGRHAPLAAALLLALLTNMVIGACVAVSYIATGLDAASSLLAGAAMAAIGITFAVGAGIAAQLTTTARGANGIAAATVGGAFLVRAIGDMQSTVSADGLTAYSGWLSWLSPIGIARNARPFAENEWWVLALLAGIVLAGAGLAFWLARQRDVGAGLLPARKGRAHAKPSLLSVLGLTWRLQRGLLLGWAIAIVVLAVSFGAVAKEVGSFVNANDQTREIIALLGGSQNIVNAYLAFSLLFLAVAIVAYALQALQRLRAEEAAGRLELLLATHLSRGRWLWAHVAVVAAGAAVLLALNGAAAGLAYGLTINEPWQQMYALGGAALAFTPVALLFAGVATLLFATLPRFAVAFSWAAFAFAYAIMQFGELLQLPDWLKNISPFQHLPRLPAEDLTWAPLLSMSAIAFALLVVATVLFRRRNSSAA